MKIYILSYRCGVDMFEPEVFHTEKEANDAADKIMEEVLRDAYDWEDDGDNDASDMTFEELVKWAEDSGYGDERFFWTGYDDATALMVTEKEV